MPHDRKSGGRPKGGNERRDEQHRRGPDRPVDRDSSRSEQRPDTGRPGSKRRVGGERHHGPGRSDTPDTSRSEQPLASDARPDARANSEPRGARIFGIHAVAAALANPARAIHRLLLTDNAENRLAEAVTARGVKSERVHPRDLDRILGADTVHQGVLLDTAPLTEPALADLLARAGCLSASEGANNISGPLVVLDQVTDPHNVGAILRSAAVFGASGLVMTRRNSPELSGVLAKTASGALEHVPVALVTNLARALEELADAGVTRIGLDGEAETRIEDAEFHRGAVALVLGSEGKGLRRLTREGCDRLCCISTAGGMASLNVSTAAAIALHTATLARRGRLAKA